MNVYDFNALEVIHTGVLGFRKIEVNVKGDNSSITRWASWFPFTMNVRVEKRTR